MTFASYVHWSAYMEGIDVKSEVHMKAEPSYLLQHC